MGRAATLEGGLSNVSTFRFLFQLALRESVWPVATGIFTDAVELADELESLGFLEGEYAMRPKTPSW